MKPCMALGEEKEACNGLPGEKYKKNVIVILPPPNAAARECGRGRPSPTPRSRA